MPEIRAILERDIFPYLPAQLRCLLEAADSSVLQMVAEIRVRSGQPFLLTAPGRDYYISEDGAITDEAERAYFCTTEDVAQVVRAVCRNSFYALEEELRRGYITLEGGHRIGLAGQAVVERGEVKALKNFSSVNIRLAREIKYSADKLLPHLFDEKGRLKNMLLVAPPCCGKTTLLRDIIRSLSRGGKAFRGMQVGVVDERSEIAACKDGCITNDLGWRVDVLDGCPKACGMLMLIRTMAPQVIVTDEIGRAEDVAALEEALHAGVRVIASVHGETMEDLLRRPHVRTLVEASYFDCYVFLANHPSVGTIREILPAVGRQGT